MSCLFFVKLPSFPPKDIIIAKSFYVCYSQCAKSPQADNPEPGKRTNLTSRAVIFPRGCTLERTEELFKVGDAWVSPSMILTQLVWSSSWALRVLKAFQRGFYMQL